MILTGNCLDLLPTFEAESVQCCVTSPPYWGLRDYGLPPSVWDAVPGCEHEWGDMMPAHHPGQVQDNKAVHSENATGQNKGSGSFCQLCGAWRGCFGLEPTPELYVQHSVQIFREVRRVLRDDGCLFLNLGDSYASGGGKDSHGGGYRGGHDKSPKAVADNPLSQPNRQPLPGLKPKDLVGIPWRVAFALQADGWWLRQDIIWNKPNPMPESVTDRCTKSHEYIFLLTKSARYFYDAEAVKEPNAPATVERAKYHWCKPDTKAAQYQDMNGLNRNEAYPMNESGRNRRSVWTITTKPFKEAHFATFPPEIPEICIKAGSKVGDTILDPFSGAGTTGMVAEKLGRKFIGIELNPTYVSMSESRIYSQCGGLLNGC
jgi:DNA modification methylase